MELDLSLGDSSKPLIGFMENQHREASNELGLGFNTTLSIGPVITTQTDQQQQIKTKTNNNSNSTENPNPVLNQLDLLPPLSFPWHSPSENGNDPFHIKLQKCYLFHLLSFFSYIVIKGHDEIDNLYDFFIVVVVGSLLVSTEFGGSSRGLDVNVVPLAVVVAEDEAALSSSPNSAASSFQMDLCIYSGGGGGGSLSGSGGNKREFSDGEGYYQRNCSRVSDDDDNCGGGNTRKKLRLSKDQSAFLEESFKEHNTLNPVCVFFSLM